MLSMCCQQIIIILTEIYLEKNKSNSTRDKNSILNKVWISISTTN